MCRLLNFQIIIFLIYFFNATLSPINSTYALTCNCHNNNCSANQVVCNANQNYCYVKQLQRGNQAVRFYQAGCTDQAFSNSDTGQADCFEEIGGISVCTYFWGDFFWKLI